MILHMHSEEQIDLLTNQFKAKRSELIEKKINDNARRLQTKKKRETEKYLQKLFPYEDQKATIQNLYHEDDYIPADDALQKYYKKL